MGKAEGYPVVSTRVQQLSTDNKLPRLNDLVQTMLLAVPNHGGNEIGFSEIGHNLGLPVSSLKLTDFIPKAQVDVVEYDYLTKLRILALRLYTLKHPSETLLFDSSETVDKFREWIRSDLYMSVTGDSIPLHHSRLNSHAGPRAENQLQLITDLGFSIYTHPNLFFSVASFHENNNKDFQLVTILTEILLCARMRGSDSYLSSIETPLAKAEGILGSAGHFAPLPMDVPRPCLKYSMQHYDRDPKQARNHTSARDLLKSS
jgi:hypothetical protein